MSKLSVGDLVKLNKYTDWAGEDLKPIDISDWPAKVINLEEHPDFAPDINIELEHPSKRKSSVLLSEKEICNWLHIFGPKTLLHNFKSKIDNKLFEKGSSDEF